MFEEEVKCHICGEKSNHAGVGSTNAFGPPDLDTRPPEMERSTIYCWIQRCPSCGYCSYNISECDNEVREIVTSKEYQNIVSDSEMPKVAASFLALSYQNEMQEKYHDSVWGAIHAAWICDDENNLESSTKCRKQAISLIEKSNNHNQKFTNQAGASETITIDLMRRSGMHQEALELSAALKTEEFEEIIRQVIQYEEELIAKGDTAAHTISEVNNKTV